MRFSKILEKQEKTIAHLLVLFSYTEIKMHTARTRKR